VTSFKSLLIILGLALTTISSATTYYVATTGDDKNQGNKEYPFKTLNKAWSVVTAGDTIFMRGGTYNNSIMPATTYLRNKNGTSSDPIVITNYPNEKPVLDYGDAVFTTQKSGIWIENVKYLHLKGIRITNIRQPMSGDIPQYGIMLWNNVSNSVFEQMETDHIGGWGVTIGDYCTNNLFLNCDSHHNADPYSSIPFGWSDGFQSGSSTSTNNIFRGCRAWENSDDGWDFRLYDGTVILESCWSFRNGYKPNSTARGGNGEGFKLGIKRLPSTNSVLRTVLNCVAFDNYMIGFHTSIVSGYGTFKSILYNNTAFRNGTSCNGQGFCFEQPAVENVLKNNLSYDNPRDYIYPVNISQNNSWNRSTPVSGADFQSLDTTGVSGPRKANGDLPDLLFLRLSQSSTLIDAGVTVGYPYYGNAPDIGALETVVGDSHVNKLPLVNISSPSKGVSYTMPATVTIDVDAFDSDGTIDKVELFDGSRKLSEISSAPFSFTLKDLPAGTYNLKAVATDNLKASSTSDILEITVVQPNEEKEYFNLYPNPNNGRFTVDFSSLTDTESFMLTVVDLIGNTVFREEISANESTRQFDLSYLNSGIYILMIVSGKILLTQKLILNRLP
jgi:hypothetical protein